MKISRFSTKNSNFEFLRLAWLWVSTAFDGWPPVPIRDEPLLPFQNSSHCITAAFCITTSTSQPYNTFLCCSFIFSSAVLFYNNKSSEIPFRAFGKLKYRQSQIPPVLRPVPNDNDDFFVEFPLPPLGIIDRYFYPGILALNFSASARQHISGVLSPLVPTQLGHTAIPRHEKEQLSAVWAPGQQRHFFHRRRSLFLEDRE